MIRLTLARILDQNGENPRADSLVRVLCTLSCPHSFSLHAGRLALAEVPVCVALLALAVLLSYAGGFLYTELPGYTALSSTLFPNLDGD